MEQEDSKEKLIIEREHLQQMLDLLNQQGYELVGPTVNEGTIIYDTLNVVADLPVGQTVEQEGGTARLIPGQAGRLFGFTGSAHSWKRFLYPPTRRLWQANRVNGSFELVEEPPDAPKYAFIGVRPCDLAAIAVQDKVFMGGDYVDPTYRRRREQAFIVAVNCGQVSNTCFCSSMKSGPRAEAGFDLALTEIMADDRHYFVVEVGTKAGAAVIDAVPHSQAGPDDEAQAAAVIKQAEAQMGRQLDTDGLRELLYRNLDHPRWDAVAERCLACANCTMVCPTCFCTTVEDVTDLTGRQAERWRKWDSCFTTTFSYIHGGSVRASAKARYRQWLTHKLASWVDQFGTFGCVGCGRCIAWCPVGIDITHEVQVIKQSDAAAVATKET